MWDLGGRLLVVEWRVRYGLYAVSLVRSPWGMDEQVIEYPHQWVHDVKRRQLPTGDGAPVPALSGETKVLAKFPRLMEFLTAVYYDDKTVRIPGTWRFSVQGLTFALTLTDVDAGMRITLRAAALDDVLALAEQVLKMDDQPWEVDPYAKPKPKARGKRK